MSATPLGRDAVPGHVVRVVEIPARHGAALEVARGLVLRVVDVEGQQVGDFVCFNRDDLGERYSPQNTVLFNRTIYCNPASNWSAGNFGQVFTQCNSARSVQLGFRFDF